MNATLDQSVIEKSIEVLHKTDDGDRLTVAELQELQWLVNHYHKLDTKDTRTAISRLQNMLTSRGIS